MGFFTPSFDKPGKGIDKDAPEKRSFFRFFDIFFRKFWKLISVNLLYLVTALPTLAIVFFLAGMISGNIFASESIQSLMHNLAQASGGDETQVYNILYVSIDLIVRLGTSLIFLIFWGMGPVTAGVTYIYRNYAKETHAWVWSDFVKAFKENFKQAIGVYLIDLVAFVLLFTAFVVYRQMSGFFGAMRYVILIIGLVYTLMHPYIYQLMITFEMKFKDLYRNAFLFAVGKLPSNFLSTVILALLHGGLAYIAVFCTGGYLLIALVLLVLLECLILISFSGLLTNFNAYQKIKILIPQEEVKVKSLSEED